MGNIVFLKLVLLQKKYYSNGEARSNPVIPTKPEDIEFVRAMVAQVRP